MQFILKLPYQLVFPKYLTWPFLLKYVKPLGFGNQASLPPLQAPWGVTHKWTPFGLLSGLPLVIESDAISLGYNSSQTIKFF